MDEIKRRAIIALERSRSGLGKRTLKSRAPGLTDDHIYDLQFRGIIYVNGAGRMQVSDHFKTHGKPDWLTP